MSPAPGWRQAPPDELVKKVMLDIQNVIVADKEIRSGDREKSVRLIEEKALPHFDQTGMTALAVGVHWRKATPEQKKRLVEEFRTLILRTYASSISAFADWKFEFRPLTSPSPSPQIPLVYLNNYLELIVINVTRGGQV